MAMSDDQESEGFELKYFLQDLKGLIIHPKETAKKVADTPCIPLAFISIFLAGCSMGFRKLIFAKESLDALTGKQIEITTQTIVDLGLRDAKCVTPFLIPFILVISWYVAAFAINFFSEKVGGFEGSYRDILSVLGYLGIELFIFEGFILLLSLIEVSTELHFIGIIIWLLYIAFLIWFLFAGTFCVEAIYGMPMSYSGMIFWGVILAIIFFYYVGIEMIFEKVILVECFKGKYAI